MNAKTIKKNNFFLILLTTLFIVLLGTGVYFLLKDNISSKYNVDRYPDTVNWCNTDISNNEMGISCNALLLNITAMDDKSSCFEVQIVTQNKELKNLKICEKNESLEYENAILSYKKLMPISIHLKYNRESILGKFSLFNISLKEQDNVYTQKIVNEDILNLAAIDLSTTTIQNGVNFCPKTDTLPDYVNTGIRNTYLQFYNKNILGKDSYTDISLYNWENNTDIKILYGCDSQVVEGYLSSCDSTKIEMTDKLKDALLKTPNEPSWDKEINIQDKVLLKQISALYDNSQIILPKYQADYLFYIVDALNTGNHNEELYCGTYKLLKAKLSSDTSLVNKYTNDIYSYISTNIARLHSITCINLLSKDNIDIEGRYVKYSMGKDIMNRCINLNSFLTNK